jgi:amidase
MERVHAFGDDALGDHDAVGVATLLRIGAVSVEEVTQAAIARAERVEPVLGAIAFPAFDKPITGAADGLFAGVPTFIKDNTNVRGLPTSAGSLTFPPRPAAAHGVTTRLFLDAGVTVLGKSRMPEFGFNASTEFAEGDPARNPWNTEYSAGASSGGAAVLVASGVVPIAHANDGGGSIRIPAAACGLVGLKPSRGRVIQNERARRMPIDILADGVVSRSVRDTATFLAAAERHWRNPALPPLGLVDGPAKRRLRIGMLVDSPTGVPTDAQTRAAVTDTARTLEKLGHHVDPIEIPIDDTFVQDFVDYWGMLAFFVGTTGKFILDREFDATKLDGLSRGLLEHYRRNLLRTPAILRRLSRARHDYARLFNWHDLVLTPVLAHVTPPLGHLRPTVPFDELLDRLVKYVAFTPLNNVSGGPGIALPTGAAANGLPIGVHFSAAHGKERTLLEIAYELEQATPWRKIQN